MSREETVIKHHLVSVHSEQKKQHTGSYPCDFTTGVIYTYLIQRKQVNGVPVRAIKAYRRVEAEILLILNLAPVVGG
jgi:hypothetical protein